MTNVEAYSVFSGTDITAVVGNTVLAQLQAISFSTTREKGPLYTMHGGPDALGFASNKRAHAGTAVFLMIYEDAIKELSNNGQNAEFYAPNNDLKYTPGVYGGSSVGRDLAQLFSDNSNAFDAASLMARTKANAWYPDQLPPFDIVLVAANEAGAVKKMTIKGCVIMNEGSGISVDDLVIEQQYTLLFRARSRWETISKPQLGSK